MNTSKKSGGLNPLSVLLVLLRKNRKSGALGAKTIWFSMPQKARAGVFRRVLMTAGAGTLQAGLLLGLSACTPEVTIESPGPIIIQDKPAAAGTESSTVDSKLFGVWAREITADEYDKHGNHKVPPTHTFVLFMSIKKPNIFEIRQGEKGSVFHDGFHLAKGIVTNEDSTLSIAVEDTIWAEGGDPFVGGRKGQLTFQQTDDSHVTVTVGKQFAALAMPELWVLDPNPKEQAELETQSRAFTPYPAPYAITFKQALNGAWTKQ